MTHWARKATDTLAEALNRHIRDNPELTEENRQLQAIYLSVQRASGTIATTEGELQRFRASVCEVCRRHEMYECDVPSGWSENCALVFNNTTYFGDL
jgi:hypothetical protein